MTERRSERHAVIISVAAYAEDSGLFSYNSIAESADRLCELFAEKSGGYWGSESIVPVRNPKTPHEVMDAVARGMEVARGGGQLLVYYIGHGEQFTSPHSDVHLALSTSRDRVPWSFLALDHIKAEMRRYHDCSRVLVLDCCYCAAAGALGRPSVPATVSDAGPVEQQTIQRRLGWEEPGTCVLTAVSPTSYSQLTGACRSDGLTEFSGLLIDVLEEGIPGAASQLTVREVCQAMRAQADPGKLKPDIFSHGPKTPVIFPNRWAPVGLQRESARDAWSQEQRLSAADIPEVMAAWIHRQGSLADIPAERVKDFVTRQLAGAPAERVTEIVHCAHLYEDGDQEWLHGSLSSPLLGRDAYDSGQVLAALDSQNCPECRALAQKISQIIIDRGGPETLLKLMLGRERGSASSWPPGEELAG
ncbi:MAG: caspase family protein [Streptomycetaceae bacterium]|nr:caspase family protein [Streptomycetaceae bacterium]